MFTENVHWIAITCHVVISNRTGCNSKASAVVGQSGVTLVKLAMGGRGHINDHHVVTEHVAWSFHGHTEVSQSNAQIDDLFRASASGNILQSEGGSLDGRLQLGEPINRRLVEEM